jgi:hypothetical protein
MTTISIFDPLVLQPTLLSRSSLMNRYTICIAAALALSTSFSNAFAQGQPTYRNFCHTAGTAPQEPIGDRAGHAISALTMICRVEGGPMDGAVMTGSLLWEWDGPSAMGRGGIGIYRKAGASLIWSNSEAKNTLIMVDGKVTGFSSTGRGTYTLGTGSAAALTGKGYTFVTKSTGFSQYVIETTNE